MRRVAILLELVLGGCTHLVLNPWDRTWTRPGATDDDFDGDRTECVQNAQGVRTSCGMTLLGRRCTTTPVIDRGTSSGA